jgi:chromosome segregation ATPase
VRPSPQVQKPVEVVAPLVEPPPESPIELALQKTLADLSQQIERLTLELQAMRKDTERNATSMELILQEERLSKIEAKIGDLTDQKFQLDAQEQEIQRRQRNIQQELIMRGGQFLRRDQAEAAIRAELQRALDDTTAQRDNTQQRILELNNQAEQLRLRIATLLKKFEKLETRPEGQK